MLESLPSSNAHWERLAPALRARADVAGSGELLWPVDVAMTIVRWLADENLGILGGEVYAGHRQARGLFRFEWSTAPQWGLEESWAAYVRRAESQATQSLEGELSAPSGDPARTFLAVAAEEHYPAFLRVT